MEHDAGAMNIPVRATVVFSITQAIHVCEMYAKAMSRTGNHPPIYLTGITGIFEEHYRKTASCSRSGETP